jgi:hypothetical protein
VGLPVGEVPEQPVPDAAAFAAALTVARDPGVEELSAAQWAGRQAAASERTVGAQSALPELTLVAAAWAAMGSESPEPNLPA